MANKGHILPTGTVLPKTFRPEDVTVDDLRHLSKDSFALWVLTSGCKPDHNEFDFNNHRYLLPMYLDNSDEIVWRKAAQMGATVFLLLRLLWWLESHPGRKAGLYFPTSDGVQNVSKDRLTPLIESCPSIKAITDPNDKLGLRKVGSASLYMYHIGGVASKDSVPLDYLSFDEVRLMDMKDIDQTLHRISHSPYRKKVLMSTCQEYDTKIIVRRKAKKYCHTSPHVELKSFRELENTWDQYQALCMGKESGKYIPTFRDITAFHNNGMKEVVRVNFDDGTSVLCTEDHKYATITKQKSSNYLRYEPIGSLSADSSLIAAKNLNFNKEHGSPFDALTLYIIGAYVAEGCFLTDTVMRIAQLRDKVIWRKTIEWAERNDLNYSTGDTYVNVSLCTRPDLLELFKSTGNKCYKKRFPEIVMKSSASQIKHLMDGYIEGDGYIRKSGAKEAVTTSKTLANQVKFLFMRLGDSAYIKPRKKIDGNLQAWDIVCSKNSKLNKRELGDKFRLANIVNVESTGLVVQVADITVDQYHNYILENGFVVHNCGAPDDTIDKLYKQGKMFSWVSMCGCSDGCNLATTFPDCVVKDDPRRPGEIYLRCPKCKWEIKDPQNGRYLAMNPDADFNSYHASQLVSKYRPLKDIWREYTNTTNMTEFYNATLGLPYIDDANRGVSLEELQECINPELRWAKDEPRNKRGHTAMGIDQGAGYCMAVIMDFNKDRTKKRIRHVEIIEQTNPHYMRNNERVSPYERCSELMNEFNVDICLTDGMPNFNDALAFAQRHPRKVFMAYYSDGQKEIVKWLDKSTTREHMRKAGPFLKFKYTASVGRFPSLSIMLGEWTSGNIEIPPLDGIRQYAHNEKSQVIEPESPARRLFSHLPRLIKNFKLQDETTGKGYWEFVFYSGDPHLAHATNYCNIALERLRRQPVFTFA